MFSELKGGGKMGWPGAYATDLKNTENSLDPPPLKELDCDGHQTGDAGSSGHNQVLLWLLALTQY